MKKLYNIFLISLAAIITFSGCVDEVILKLNTMNPVIVIDGKISNDSVPFVVSITTTADYYSLEIPIVKDAFVTIGGSDGSKDTLIFNENSGQYQSNPNSPNFIRPCKVGVSYTLNVTYNNKTYTATETCLPQNPIDSIYVKYSPKNGFIQEGYYLWEHTTEKPGKGDYYQWKLYKNDTMVFDDFYFLGDDQYLKEDGQTLDADFFTTFQLGDSIVLEQLAISKQYYNFLIAVQSQTDRGGSPFSAPPTNIAGNISHGGLGYFSVQNLIRKKLVVK